MIFFGGVMTEKFKEKIPIMEKIPIVAIRNLRIKNPRC
jgi:hypothetical protein